MRKLVKRFLLISTGCIVIISCTRNEIEFGETPENNYTNIVFTDTVGVSLSTLITDSFATNSATLLLLGKYKDPYFGTVSAKNFFQMSVPAGVPTITDDAVFDSLTFIFHPTEYYYGDTSQAQTFYVNELGDPMSFTYGSSFYNTSSIIPRLPALGSKTIRLRPIADDSVIIRLNNTKGAELFSKLKGQSQDILVQDNFLNYFYGISLTSGNDLGAVYGINGSAGNMLMRLYYHTTIPQPVNMYIDFTSLANEYSFNQVISDRAGTALAITGANITEIPASQTNNVAFLQPGTGVNLKMTFPSLHGIIANEKIIKLVKAELYIRPAYMSFDKGKYRLPDALYLAKTDASNTVGDEVLDSTGAAVQYANPVTDDIYGENNYYRFNVTSYINELLTNSGTEDNGFFLLNSGSASAISLNRIIVNNSLHENQSTKLRLYFVEINK